MKVMFKLIATAALFFMSALTAQAQVSGSDYRSTANSLIPDLNLENKILFINVWQSSNIDSRENNKEFLRVSNIFKDAKLKNGSKGVAYINLCLDKDTYLWMMSIKRDSIVSNYNLENTTNNYASLAKLFNDYPGNVTIGSDGTILAKDIKKENCFNLFRSLITR